MIINDDILRRDTIKLIKQVDQQIAVVNQRAAELGIEGFQLRDQNGNWPMVALLLAKVQAHAALVQLQK